MMFNQPTESVKLRSGVTISHLFRSIITACIAIRSSMPLPSGSGRSTANILRAYRPSFRSGPSAKNKIFSAQTRAPECRTPYISAGHALRVPAPDLPPNLRLHPAHPRSAAPATSPNSDAPLDTPHSVPAAGVDIPRRASLTTTC